MCAKHRVGSLRLAFSPNLPYVDEEFDGCEKFHLYKFSAFSFTVASKNHLGAFSGLTEFI